MLKRNISLIGVCLLVIAGFAEGAAGDAKQPPVNAPASHHDYVHDHPTIYSGGAHVFRSATEEWLLDLENVDPAIVLTPRAGRTDIPSDTDLAGRINIGLHGTDMVILLETEDGKLYQAVLQLSAADAVDLGGPQGTIPKQFEGIGQAPLTPATMPRVLLLIGLQERLRFVYATASALAPFGSNQDVSDPDPVAATNCPGGRCSCFLGCNACCAENQVPDCDCNFLGPNRCRCELANRQ